MLIEFNNPKLFLTPQKKRLQTSFDETLSTSTGTGTGTGTGTLDYTDSANLMDKSTRLQGRFIAQEIARYAAEQVSEILWPTRCALCDRPGKVLCEQCESKLHYIDYWQACPRCGAPFGRVICTECNAIALKRMNRDALPFKSCISATIFDEESGRIVRTYKDQGEQRLANDMARLMEHAIPPSWPVDAITFIPASEEAIRRRDFDHGQLLAKHLAKLLNKPLVYTLENPCTEDQRELSRKERNLNLSGNFHAKECTSQMIDLAPKLLLVDDVYTTGATLCSATDALLEAGFKEIRCASFARVY